jgi:hypothetical protein
MGTIATSAFEMAEYQMPTVGGVDSFPSEFRTTQGSIASCAAEKSRKLQLLPCSSAITSPNLTFFLTVFQSHLHPPHYR